MLYVICNFNFEYMASVVPTSDIVVRSAQCASATSAAFRKIEMR